MKQRKINFIWVKVLFLISTFMFLSGCSYVSAKYPFQMPKINTDNVNRMVWPSPPDVPRYAFIGHIYGEANSQKQAGKSSAVGRFFAALVGLGEEKEELINLIQPQQLTFDDEGRIYVADAGRRSVFVFDEKKGEFTIWDESQLNIPFLSPVGVVFAEGSIWVTDSELAVVYRLDKKGELKGTIAKGVTERPTGITYDSSQKRLFIADTAESNIKVFNTQGELIGLWGQPGSAEGELNHPTFITYHRGNLYVADSLNARVQIFDDLGRYTRTLGKRGLYVGEFSRPKGVALDSESNIYVTESYYDHVLVYNQQGKLLMSLGGPGFDAGQFSQPTGLWVDQHDRLFVSDMLNSRISIFQYLGSN